MAKGNDFAGLFFAFIGGAVAGATIVALTTPKSGPETRVDLMKLLEEGKNSASKMPNALKDASDAAGRAFTDTMRAELGGDGAHAS